MISEFLFHDENSTKDEKTSYVNLKIEIRELLNNSFNRKVLTDVLMDLRKDLSGITLARLFELYQSLGLHHDSYKKLESWKWQKISKGIFELTQMKVADSYVFITKFINDKRPTIRKQAELSIISLKPEGVDFFLDTTTYRISEWQQLKILEVLKSKKNYRPPSFKHWLTSKNKDVVLFALRLMKHYNQSDGNEALIELLKHKNEKIRLAAIAAIQEFNVIEAIENLKLVFWNSSIDVKIALLNAIAVLGSKDEIEFLNSIATSDSNFNVKSKALASINVIAPSSIMPTVGIQDTRAFKVPKNVLTDLSNETTVSENLEPEDVLPISSVPTKKTSEVKETEVNSKPDVLEVNATTERIKESTVANSEGFDQFEVKDFNEDFLPFVTAQELEENFEKYHPAEVYETTAPNFLELEVVFEVTSHNTQESHHNQEEFFSEPNNEESTFPLEPEELAFLPIVVDVPEKPISGVEEQDNSVKDVNEISVHFSEIRTNGTPQKDIRLKLMELVPLPEPPKSSSLKNTSQTNESIIPTSLNSIDMKKIRKIKFEGVEIESKDKNLKKEEALTVQPGPADELGNAYEHKEQSTLEWVLEENEGRIELKQKIKSLVKEQDDILFKIPRPKFYNEYEIKTVALLDDIEALGDQREISFLEEMLRDEKNHVFLERIQFVIEKITDTTVLRKEPISNQNNGFSVFEEFFGKVDFPSKLILLDQIVALGDIKEIPFLNRLLTDPSKKIRKKAKICVDQLRLKLENEKNEKNTASDIKSKASNFYVNTTKPPEEKVQPFSVFDIDFELSPENPDELETKTGF